MGLYDPDTTVAQRLMEWQDTMKLYMNATGIKTENQRSAFLHVQLGRRYEKWLINVHQQMWTHLRKYRSNLKNTLKAKLIKYMKCTGYIRLNKMIMRPAVARRP